MSADKSWIRERAHQLWEAAGRPHGKDEEHWLLAEQEFARLTQSDGIVKPAKAPTKAAKGSKKKIEVEAADGAVVKPARKSPSAKTEEEQPQPKADAKPPLSGKPPSAKAGGAKAAESPSQNTRKRK